MKKATVVNKICFKKIAKTARNAVHWLPGNNGSDL